MKRKKELIIFIFCLLVVQNNCQGFPLHSEKRQELSPLPFDVHASDREDIAGSSILITTEPAKDSDDRKDFPSSSPGNLGTSAKARSRIILPSPEVNTVQPNTFQQRDIELESSPNNVIAEQALKKIASKEMKDNLKVLSLGKNKVPGHALRESATHAGIMSQKKTNIKDFETSKEPEEVTESTIRKQTVKKQSFQGKKDETLLEGKPVLRKPYVPTQPRARSHVPMVSHSKTRLNDQKTSIARKQKAVPTTTTESLSPSAVAAITVGLIALAMVLLVVGRALWRKCENRFLRRTDPELGSATPSMTGVGEELSDEEIIFERNFIVTRSENESSTPQSISSSTPIRKVLLQREIRETLKINTDESS